jgi:predicted transcriptional regulator
MTEEETSETLSREEKKMIKDLKILTAISLGTNKNKELAKLLDTDKSFAAKKIKDLQERGLVYKEGEGKDTRYRVNQSGVMSFLQRRVTIRWRKQVKFTPSPPALQPLDEDKDNG